MRLNTKSWAIASGALLLGSIAYAQSDTDQPGANTDLAPSRELTAQSDVSLTPQQMLKKSEEFIARMDRGARAVREQLKIARQERDVIKVLCLNDKLNQIDVALATATERRASLASMVQSNQPDRVKHEYTIISVLRERVETLLTEANQCVGEELGYLSDTQVNVSIDPDIPDGDPSGFPNDPLIQPVPPTIIPPPPPTPPTPPASPG